MDDRFAGSANGSGLAPFSTMRIFGNDIVRDILHDDVDYTCGAGMGAACGGLNNRPNRNWVRDPFVSQRPGGMQTVSPGPQAALVWATTNPAHAVQRVSAIITFNESMTSLTLKRLIDAVRPIAKQLGLLKEEDVNTVVYEMKMGSAPKKTSEESTGVAFQDVRGAQVIQALIFTNDAIKFETIEYTRWLGFRKTLEECLGATFHLALLTVQVKSIMLEYQDLFFAINEGDQDASLILERKSDSISHKAFNKRHPFHSHSGWFEFLPDGVRKLVNVDVNVTDANGPAGLRRVISIRTHEAEQAIEGVQSAIADITDSSNVLKRLDALHKSLKVRVAAVLTRDARAMISLGN